MDELSGKFVLGLETGLDGGSVSILKNGKQIDYAAGTGILSRSEDLLAIIEELLFKNAINKSDINLIAISDEPGSITGLRIGIATAVGLSAALSAKVCRLSYLKTLAAASEREGKVLSAHLTQRNGIFFSEYEFRQGRCEPAGKIRNKSGINEFIDVLHSLKNGNISFVFNEELFNNLKGFWGTAKGFRQNSIFHINKNPAELLGLRAEKIASDNEA